MTPTIILPFITNNKSNYNVRTLLDSGSSVSWISRDILEHIKFSSKGKIKVKVHHFNGERTKKYEAVQIYIDKLANNSDCLTQTRGYQKGLQNTYKEIAIDCLVSDTFTYHKMVPGIKHFLKTNTRLPDSILKRVIEPDSKDINHEELSLSTALILSNTDKIKIMGVKSKNIVLPEHDLILEYTTFGYAVSGKVPKKLIPHTYDLQVGMITPTLVNNVSVSPQISEDQYFQGYQAILSHDYENLDNMIRISWEKELSLGVLRNETHTDDDKAKEIFQKGVEFDNILGQFVTPLPFNGKEVFLPTNERQARIRTYRQNELMERNKNYLEGGIEAFEKMKNTDSVELVTPDMGEGQYTHYLPWRFVVKDSETTSFRMCMDASAKPKKGDVSLNQCLLQGPNMTLNLAKCLIRFTLGKFRAVSDLEKAFLMIVVFMDHRNCLRFFWPEIPGNPRSRLLVYRFRVVLFGSISSPFLLAAVLEKIIEEDIKDNTTQKILKNSIYVDNFAAAFTDPEILKNLYIECRKVFLSRHFNLRQWSSNCEEINNLAKEDGVFDDRKTISVLGKIWCEDDQFAFREMKKWSGDYNKWAVLSFASGPFDPTGELVPIIVQMRAFIRQLWEQKKGWKEDFSQEPDLVKRFDQLREEIAIALERKSPIETVVTSETEIHIFSDASTSALGAVMYLVTPKCKIYPEGQVKQVMAKGKLTPPIQQRSKKEDTIPRWELLALLISAQMANFVTKDIDELKNKKMYLWVDNTAVLEWCAADELKDNFVIRRVTDIRKLVPNAELRYINTKSNPADIITRNITGKQLLENELWWKGPEWLKEKENWPEKEKEYNLQMEWISEVQSYVQNISKKGKTRTTPQFYTLSEFFIGRDYNKALKILRWPLRWRNGRSSKPRDNGKLNHLKSKHEYNKFPLNESEVPIIIDESSGIIKYQQPWEMEERMYVIEEAFKILQRECYPREIELLESGKPVKQGPCRSWNLYKDSTGLVRCGALRLPETMEGTKSQPPILVHGDHPMTRSFLRNQHIKHNCLGVNGMINKVKSSLHGIRLNFNIKQVVKDCSRCNIVKAVPYHYPGQGTLPLERLQARRPFTCVGVDYSGPHWVRDRYNKVKIYVCLFTCLVTRGVYLVKVQSCSSVDFINALFSLMARRGQPDLLLSDNATNFSGTSTMLKNLSKRSDVVKTLTEQCIQWKFTPPESPWQGGCYERLIGLFKRELMKMTRNGMFTQVEFERHLLESEQILNSRPLCRDGNQEVITPAHFLNSYNNMEKEISNLDKERFLEEVMNVRKELPALFKQTKVLRDKFWTNLWSQYLDKLRFTQDKTKNKYSKVPTIGEVCIIWEDSPRNSWKKGIILELIYSEDGKIRSCKVKTQNGIIVRPLKLLYSLEMSETDTYERNYHIDQAIYSNNVPKQTSEKTDDKLNLPDDIKSERNAKIGAILKMKKISDYEKGKIG